ncbi:MAG: hypothetical protein FWC72_01260 [Oscillospiraceae bacterium]|nr:hypothetical protein [Oscillospiraceae bacterium]
MTKEAMIRLTGFRQVGDEKNPVGFGTLFGYPVEATAPRNGRLTLIFTAAEPPKRKAVKQLGKLVSEDTELRGAVTVVQATENVTHPNTFLVTLSSKDETAARDLYARLLSRLEGALQGLEGITAPENCIICAQGSADTLAKYDGAVNKTHMACLQRWKNEATETFENKAQNPGTLLGIVGGLIGGVVGAVPALIALGIFHYFVWVLFALIPLGVFYGWKLLRGKLSRITTIFTIFYSIAVSIVVWVGAETMMARAEGIYFSLFDTFEFIFSLIRYAPELFAEAFLRNALMALGAAVVGIWISWRQITRTDQAALVETQAIVDAAVPMEREASTRETTDEYV